MQLIRQGNCWQDNNYTFVSILMVVGWGGRGYFSGLGKLGNRFHITPTRSKALTCNESWTACILSEWLFYVQVCQTVHIFLSPPRFASPACKDWIRTHYKYWIVHQLRVGGWGGGLGGGITATLSGKAHCSEEFEHRWLNQFSKISPNQQWFAVVFSLLHLFWVIVVVVVVVVVWCVFSLLGWCFLLLH